MFIRSKVQKAGNHPIQHDRLDRVWKDPHVLHDWIGSPQDVGN